MRLDHLLSKEHSPLPFAGWWSELAPVSVPSVDRLVAHGVEHYRVGPLGIRVPVEFRARWWSGRGFGTEHTVGCLKQHRHARLGCSGVVVSFGH